MSKSINELWDVIGVGGGKLIPFNKLAFVTALANLAWKQDGTPFSSESLWLTLGEEWEEGSLALIPDAATPITHENIQEIFSAITLSANECWQAITEIAIVAANKEVGATTPRIVNRN